MREGGWMRVSACGEAKGGTNRREEKGERITDVYVSSFSSILAISPLFPSLPFLFFIHLPYLTSRSLSFISFIPDPCGVLA